MAQTANRSFQVNKKRIFISALALLLAIGCQTSVFAADAGTSSDPLISKNYATGTFRSQFITGAKERLSARFDELYKTHVASITGENKSTGSFVKNTVDTGSNVTLTFGDSVILTAGSASLRIESGAVVNVTTGTLVSSGSRLTANNRYLTLENSTAKVIATSPSAFLCDGTVEIGKTDLPASFTDVLSSHWAFREIEALAASGLINGPGGGIFDPNANMIRADFATIIGRFAGINAGDYTGSSFSDVPVSEYYAPYVRWGSSNGLIMGYTVNSFEPDYNITRAQMATLIVRYANFAGITLPSGNGSGRKFADDSTIPGWAYDAVYTAEKAGIIKGKSGDRFDPEGFATRAEICVIIHRLAAVK